MKVQPRTPINTHSKNDLAKKKTFPHNTYSAHPYNRTREKLKSARQPSLSRIYEHTCIYIRSYLRNIFIRGTYNFTINYARARDSSRICPSAVYKSASAETLSLSTRGRPRRRIYMYTDINACAIRLAVCIYMCLIAYYGCARFVHV